MFEGTQESVIDVFIGNNGYSIYVGQIIKVLLNGEGTNTMQPGNRRLFLVSRHCDWPITLTQSDKVMNERMVYIDQLRPTRWLSACLYIFARHTRDPSGLVTIHVIHIHHSPRSLFLSLCFHDAPKPIFDCKAAFVCEIVCRGSTEHKGQGDMKNLAKFRLILA